MCISFGCIAPGAQAKKTGRKIWFDEDMRAIEFLRDLVMAVLPDAPELLETHHNAGSDALMHWLVARELTRRALTK